MKNYFLATLVVLTYISVSAQRFDHYIHDADATPREHELDISHMKLDVRFNTTKGEVMGVVTHTFSCLRQKVDSVFWDAPKIQIEKAMMVDGKKSTPIRFKMTETGVVTFFDQSLTWDKPYMLEFTYTATPKRGLYFIGWDVLSIPDPKNQTRHQLWTQGQGIDNRHWIPMYDNMNDKFVTETVITFQKDFNVLSNGDLLSTKENTDGTKTWHYKMRHPHAGYLLMLAIDKYAIKKSTTSRKTPVQFWYYPEHAANVEYTSMHTEKMIEFLEDETGVSYPWGTYSQVMVQDFIYGAMENTSATIFGDFFNVDAYSFNDRNYIGVNAHELTHQWFGDLITARSGTGTWLQESFATYYAKLFAGQLYGDDEYRWNMRGEVNSALSASEKDNYPIAHTKSGSARVYPKGSTVLHMLRYVLGDAEYKRVIKYYLEKHGYGNVETNDLNVAIQESLGLSLDWFFNQWLYRGGEPHYEVTFHEQTDMVALTINQIQNKDLTIKTFKMPVNCGIYFTDGSVLEQKVWIDKETETVTFKLDGLKKIDYILFDINAEILKKCTFKKSTEMLLAQLKGAKHMIDRYDALLALKNIPLTQKIDALFAAFAKENHWSIKAEIVKQLANDTGSADKLIKLLENADVRVRRSLLESTNDVDLYINFFASSLADKSYINIQTSLTKLVENDPKNAVNYLSQTQGFLGQNHNVRITWLGYKILQLRQDSAGLMRDKKSSYFTYMNELTLYTSSLYEFRTRINAMEAIRKYNFLSAPAIQNMFDAVLSKNSRLAAPAKDILMWYQTQFEFKRALQQVFESLNYTEDQKKQLRNAGVVL